MNFITFYATHISCCNITCNSQFTPFMSYNSKKLLMEILRYEYIHILFMLCIISLFREGSNRYLMPVNVHVSPTWAPHKVIFSTMLRAVVLCDCILFLFYRHQAIFTRRFTEFQSSCGCYAESFKKFLCDVAMDANQLKTWRVASQSKQQKKIFWSQIAVRTFHPLIRCFSFSLFVWKLTFNSMKLSQRIFSRAATSVNNLMMTICLNND